MNFQDPEQWWKNEQPEARKEKRHAIKWDPRSKWKRAWEWPLRKFYIINYDPCVWIPEEEYVWEDSPEYNPRWEGFIAYGLIFMFFGAIFGVLWLLRLMFT